MSRWVKTLQLTPPSLQDNTADADRLAAALKTTLNTDAVDVDFSLMRQLPELLRKWRYGARCVLFKDRNRWLLSAVADPSEDRPVAGLAADLGTSRVVIRLVDLSGGETLAETAFDNPQLAAGPDILARIHHAAQPGGIERLKGWIVDALNREIDTLCSTCGLAPADVQLMSVAGNTAMTHLFMGLDPRWMIREPYIPAVNRPGVQRASDLGINIGRGARVLMFPNIGSYFGGDLIAGILFSGILSRSDTAILVDVGTNAEVVVGNSEWLIACAGAAGPALEGGVTKMGMMAGPGVIDGVSIDPDRRDLQVRTIGGEPPAGICGSGLIDLAAQLFLAGMVDVRGKFVPAACGTRLVQSGGMPHFEVVSADRSATGSPLSVSQADLDSLIRSKAAMFTILETVINTVGADLNTLSSFYVAGTFGSFIKPDSAVSIGMLPDLPKDRFIPLGNSSLGGAARVLTDPEALEKVDAIRDRITYMELNVNQDFMNRFSAAKFLPHTDRTRFPSVQAPPKRN